MNNKFVVFDVETPNGKNDSICAIGVVVIDGDTSTIVDKFYSLVNPEAEFSQRNVLVHNITSDMVKDSPTFPDIWAKIGALFQGSVIVAHNVSFDICVFKKVLNNYNVECNPLYTICTLTASRNMLSLSDYKLPTVAGHFNISLDNHHDAMADTEACANIFLKLLEIDKNKVINSYLKAYDMSVGDNSTPAPNKNTLYNNKRSSKTTSSIQILLGIIMGISCDSVLTDSEISSLQKWLEENKHLEGNFPFDKVYTSIVNVLADGVVSPAEHEYLLAVFENVIKPVEACACGSSVYSNDSFNCKSICLTGEFSFGSRSEITSILSAFGAVVQKNVDRSTDFLIVGSLGSEAYSQGAYGNKAKKALELQEKGGSIKIIKEEDISNLLEGVLC